MRRNQPILFLAILLLNAPLLSGEDDKTSTSKEFDSRYQFTKENIKVGYDDEHFFIQNLTGIRWKRFSFFINPPIDPNGGLLSLFYITAGEIEGFRAPEEEGYFYTKGLNPGEEFRLKLHGSFFHNRTGEQFSLSRYKVKCAYVEIHSDFKGKEFKRYFVTTPDYKPSSNSFDFGADFSSKNGLKNSIQSVLEKGEDLLAKGHPLASFVKIHSKETLAAESETKVIFEIEYVSGWLKRAHKLELIVLFDSLDGEVLSMEWGKDTGIIKPGTGDWIRNLIK